MLVHARLPPRGVARLQRLSARPLGAHTIWACGAQGPGTGKRKSPPQLGQQFGSQHPHRSIFEQKTTKEMYKEFPFMVRVAVPLSVIDREPAGLSAQHDQDAGPATGRRRRPAPVDAAAVQTPPALPHPAAPTDLKRERLLRTHILLA